MSGALSRLAPEVVAFFEKAERAIADGKRALADPEVCAKGGAEEMASFRAAVERAEKQYRELARVAGYVAAS